MENWGLVMYREHLLLVDPVNSSQVTKQYVALVVGHELAHQLFGNLVTMECGHTCGFVSWIEYLCVDHCLPDYQIWIQSPTNDFSRALQQDALANSYPIEAQAGVGSTVKVLELMSAYADEKEFTVWETLVDNLSTISCLLANTDFHNKFKRFAEKIFNNVFEHVGWLPQPDEGPLTSMMISMVIAAHGHYGNPKTINAAQYRFADHVCGKAIHNIDLRTTVFLLAMKHGSEETFDQLCKLHSVSDSQEGVLDLIMLWVMVILHHCSQDVLTMPCLIK